jgi:hypothetical protein
MDKIILSLSKEEAEAILYAVQTVAIVSAEYFNMPDLLESKLRAALDLPTLENVPGCSCKKNGIECTMSCVPGV